MGDGEDDPPFAALGELYDELFAYDDDEHGDVSVTHLELEVCLVAYRSGLLVREDFAADRSMHMESVPREKVLELWKACAEGDVHRLDSEPWKPGYR